MNVIIHPLSGFCLISSRVTLIASPSLIRSLLCRMTRTSSTFVRRRLILAKLTLVKGMPACFSASLISSVLREMYISLSSSGSILPGICSQITSSCSSSRSATIPISITHPSWMTTFCPSFGFVQKFDSNRISFTKILASMILTGMSEAVILWSFALS